MALQWKFSNKGGESIFIKDGKHFQVVKFDGDGSNPDDGLFVIYDNRTYDLQVSRVHHFHDGVRVKIIRMTPNQCIVEFDKCQKVLVN
jgi:hypothetical protein